MIQPLKNLKADSSKLSLSIKMNGDLKLLASDNLTVNLSVKNTTNVPIRIVDNFDNPSECLFVVVKKKDSIIVRPFKQVAPKHLTNQHLIYLTIEPGKIAVKPLNITKIIRDSGHTDLARAIIKSW